MTVIQIIGNSRLKYFILILVTKIIAYVSITYSAINKFAHFWANWLKLALFVADRAKDGFEAWANGVTVLAQVILALQILVSPLPETDSTNNALAQATLFDLRAIRQLFTNLANQAFNNWLTLRHLFLFDLNLHFPDLLESLLEFTFVELK